MTNDLLIVALSAIGGATFIVLTLNALAELVYAFRGSQSAALLAPFARLAKEVWLPGQWILVGAAIALVVPFMSIGLLLPLAAVSEFSAGVAQLWTSMLGQIGWPGRMLVIILAIMSAWSVGVMIDWAITYAAARKQSRYFVQAMTGALREGKLDEALRIAESNKKSHIAKVVAAGLADFEASSGLPEEEIIEASKRALERSAAITHAELKRGLGALATIGAIAPFVGLLGTVVGIVNAFRGIHAEKVTGLTAVAGGIAEAFVATALSLFVAVPVVWAYNYFNSKIEAFDVEMDNTSKELINYFVLRRKRGT